MFMQLLANAVAETWKDKVVNAVDAILVPILVIACSVGMVWAIVVGIKMMKADDKAARDENKAKLINIAISIVAVAVLIGLFYALKNWLDTNNVEGKDFNIFDKDTQGGGGSNSSGLSGSGGSNTTQGQYHIGGNLLNTARLVKQCASMAFFGC